jgi:Raf kinase inhibitor-like YbhB/YbcL family protein
MVKKLGLLTFCACLASVMSLTAQVKSVDGPDDDHDRFRVTSTTFENNSTLPISAIHNITFNGSNVCSIDGAPGGNESPELSWTDAPRGTRSFAVVTFDVTANFTHWGMYNISPDTTELPQNAGVAGSTFGQQVVNDFAVGAEYDGPCPPPNFPPNVHHYVFTVYALDKELTLPSSANFPPTAETLFQALIEAGERGHILASAKIVGLYSTTPTGN